MLPLPCAASAAHAFLPRFHDTGYLRRSRSRGWSIFGRAARHGGSKNGPVRGADFEAGRFALAEGVVSITIDGKSAVTKKLGAVGDGDVGTMWWAVQPNCFNHAVGDYAFMFQALPTGPQETVVTAKWIVHKDAVEGVDYDLARLIEVWNSTNNEDRWLAENNQRGINSIAYVPARTPRSPRQGIAVRRLVLRCIAEPSSQASASSSRCIRFRARARRPSGFAARPERALKYFGGWYAQSGGLRAVASESASLFPIR
jgi:hypothetical protein